MNSFNKAITKNYNFMIFILIYVYIFSKFYNDYDEVMKLLSELNEKKIKTILVGVSYALLEMAEKYSCSLYDTIVMETGGMKGRKKEMIREELHSVLKNSFKIRPMK